MDSAVKEGGSVRIKAADFECMVRELKALSQINVKLNQRIKEVESRTSDKLSELSSQVVALQAQLSHFQA